MRFKYRGVEFGGRSGSLIVAGFSPGAKEVRGADQPRPNRDGTIAGRDFLGSATWAFDLSTNRENLSEALATAGDLQAVWEDPAVRLVPNTLVPLSYELDGRWRRVYGRPGAFTGPKGDVLATLGVGKVTCDFKVHNPTFFADTEQSVTLRVVPASAGGFVAPFVMPLTTVGSGAPRAGFVTSAGDAPTPLKVRFKGPIIDPWVRWGNLEVGLLGTLAYDQSVIVDPMAGTVLRGSTPVNGMLTRKTRLSGALLKPGVTDLTFGGTDLTGTATATMYWRDAYTSI